MTLIRRVLTSFREDEQAEAQMFQKDDGTFWLRASDGTETQVGSGGSQPGYAIVGIDWAGMGPLTAGAPSVLVPQSALSIVTQTGSDFTVGNNGDPSNGAILSANGGRFGAGMFFATPSDATLDGGSALQRYLFLEYQIGDNSDLSGFGFDGALPILTSGVGADMALTAAAVPGIASPGGPALYGISVILMNGFGTDSVPLDNIGNALALYSV